MQSKMRRLCDGATRQHSLELRPGFKPLHVRLAFVSKAADQLFSAIVPLRLPDACDLLRAGQQSLRDRREFSSG